MSNSDDYNLKLDAIKAIPDDQVLTPAVPVYVFLQEAENLHHWSIEDAVQLAQVGITLEMIDELPVRAGALREAQAIWLNARYSQDEAQKEWNLKAALAYALRDELLHDFRFAYRSEPELLGRIAAIGKGSGYADMIQDLNNLSVLGKANQEPLNAIAFDLLKLDIAAEQSDFIANLLAIVSDETNRIELKLIRDKAYIYLKESVDQIRLAGKYLFWQNEDRRKGYTSAFWKRKNMRKITDKPEPESSSG